MGLSDDLIDIFKSKTKQSILVNIWLRSLAQRPVKRTEMPQFPQAHFDFLTKTGLLKRFNKRQIENYMLTDIGRTISYNFYEYHKQILGTINSTSREPLDKLGINTQSSILDVGCGAGQTLFALSKHVTPRLMIGVDLNRTGIIMAKTYADFLGDIDLPSFLVSDINEMPFDDDSFTHILCRGVFMYSDSERALREFGRILKRDGLIYLNVHSVGHVRSRIFMFANLKNFLKWLFVFLNGTCLFLTGKQIMVQFQDKVYCQTFYTKERLTKLFQKHGMKITFFPVIDGDHILIIASRR